MRYSKRVAGLRRSATRSFWRCSEEKESIAQIARRHRVPDALLHRWRERFFEGGTAAAFRNDSLPLFPLERRYSSTRWP